ncbi:MAG: DUF1844 domain-containing protein [Phycisphaerales bacterium]|nr:DUF1844 domain-containing protein [Phycisphaerales bacterium]
MTTPQGGDAPKIIIDTDWKSQAQAEKEKLAAQEAAKKAEREAKAGVGPDGQPVADGPIGMQDIISMFVSQALMYLGAVPDPASGRAVVAPEYAKLHIDMLAVLEEKTKGNLTEAESKLLTRAVSELRMEYVEVSKYVAQAIKEGKIKPQGGGMGGGSGLVGTGGPGGMTFGTPEAGSRP